MDVEDPAPWRVEGPEGNRGDVTAYVPSAQRDRFWLSRTASGRVTAILWTAGTRCRSVAGYYPTPRWRCRARGCNC
eukprot:932440-Prymnesium_polylepis.2